MATDVSYKTYDLAAECELAQIKVYKGKHVAIDTRRFGPNNGSSPSTDKNPFMIARVLKTCRAHNGGRTITIQPREWNDDSISKSLGYEPTSDEDENTIQYEWKEAIQKAWTEYRAVLASWARFQAYPETTINALGLWSEKGGLAYARTVRQIRIRTQ